MSENQVNSGKDAAGAGRHLSPLGAWALAFGCVIGWGSFVMPGTTFLPEAGPLGALAGMAVAAAMILVIGVNYSYLIGQFPQGGGSYIFTRNILGEDHAFLTVWSLGLAYLSLLWANATAFILIGRYFFGNVLKWGFHYTTAGYDVYFGEVLTTILIQLFFGFLVGWAPRTANAARIFFAVVLFVSVVLVFCGVFVGGGPRPEMPGFASGIPKGIQILNIAMLAPWMYVGFETITNEAVTFRSSMKTILAVSGAAILAGMMVYSFLMLTGAAGVPEGYVTWQDYMADLDNLDGLYAMPVFFNAKSALGTGGVRLAGIAVFSALSTSVLGFYRASARVMQTMAENGLLPAVLAKEKNGAPQNALLVIMLCSLPIPFLGRAAVGWNADVSTLSVAIVYVYISICTLRLAIKQKKKREKITGLAGIVAFTLVFLFLLVPNIFSENQLATESYLMLAAWSMGGILYYWYIFKCDRSNRFGKSTIMWIMMLFLLFFSTNVWVRLYNKEQMTRIIGRVSGEADSLLMASSLIQLVLIVLALLIMFSLFTTMLRRERQMEAAKMQAEMEREKAEESSKAKSIFLSNMSHDIRTPMNAIIGYTNLARREENTLADVQEYLAKIETSSQHLLALINDVLEMSRIESGKMELEPIAVDLKRTLREVRDMFSTQMEEKNITFTVDTSQIRHGRILCDKNRLNRILLNLLSNAYKFTPQGGTVSVSVWEIDEGADGYGRYELRVADSGIGMTEEFAARVFEAFERERTSTVSGIQGTGLGMAITKSIIDLMGGTIKVNTAPGQGTEFVVRLTFELLKEPDVPMEETASEKNTAQEEKPPAMDFSAMRLLLTEDMAINREIAVMLLTNLGFSVETAENGKEAVEKVAASEPGYFDAVLMDIQMPVMNGYEAAQGIRALADQRLSKIPIIAMTANAFSEDVKKAQDVGMNGHIAKPINVNDMVNTITEVLCKAGA